MGLRPKKCLKWYEIKLCYCSTADELSSGTKSGPGESANMTSLDESWCHMSKQLEVPDVIVHYSRSEPFRSMSSVPSNQWAVAIKDLSETNAWGMSRFSDPDYLPRRLEVEKHIRNEFIKKGGKPELDHPLYFFLGRHNGFEKHPRNIGYVIQLKDIRSDAISFTYGDSLLAYNEDYRSQSGEKYKNSLCSQIFKKEDLESLFSHVDFPKTERLSIEVQLWTMPSREIVTSLDR